MVVLSALDANYCSRGFVGEERLKQDLVLVTWTDDQSWRRLTPGLTYSRLSE